MSGSANSTRHAMPGYLHLCSGNLYGGVESFLTTLARNQRVNPAGEHEFAVCFHGRLETELRQAGSTVHFLGSPRLSRPWSWLGPRQELRRILDERKPAAVISHSTWTQVILGGAVARKSLPLVAWVHGVDHGNRLLRFLASRIRPSLLILNSRFTDDSSSTWYPGVLRRILHCPVESPADDRSLRAAKRQAMEVGEETVVITMVARMEWWKGHRCLVQALARIKGDPRWQCWLVGGAQREEERDYLKGLESLVSDCGLANRVRILGDRTDVRELLAASDVFCQPNLAPEPFGIVFIEALYARLPVVSSAIGGAKEIVDATCGILVPPNDAAALANALHELINNPSRRHELGIHGPQRGAALCNPEQQIAALNRILQTDCQLQGR
jgi:glycosyltransferase involved in cell wall biosynthesis